MYYIIFPSLSQILKEELRIARGLVFDIIGVLDNVKDETNLTNEVGIFAVQMPEFKILTKDADAAKRILRMVCTGEMQPGEAAKKFVSAYKEVDDLYQLLLCNHS